MKRVAGKKVSAKNKHHFLNNYSTQKAGDTSDVGKGATLQLHDPTMQLQYDSDLPLFVDSYIIQIRLQQQKRCHMLL